ncbi:MAG: acyltransferase [Rickettsiales bacterium]|nr:acyltransferase [Rickettsiales bacterium]
MIRKATAKPTPKVAAARPVESVKNIFSVGDTNFMKGAALFFLLWHHLFFLRPSTGTITLWNGVHLAYFAAVVMKVCVAMFLLLSGYGLFESARKYERLPVLAFWRKSYVKIYLNYWLVWLIFVGIGVSFFPGGTLADAYGSKPIVSTTVANFFGVQNILRLPSYNQAWWFISVIFSMYLIFPVLLWAMRKLRRASFLVPAAFFGLMYTSEWTGGFRPINIPFITNWAFPFVLGMWLAQKDAFARAKDRIAALPADGKVLNFFSWLFIIGLAVYMRQYGKGFFKSFYVDGLLAACMIHFIYQYFTGIEWLRSAMVFAGKHSFNIFLFHNILYETYWPRFFYSLGAPIASFAALMAASVAISILLEMLKRRIGFYRLQDIMVGK